MSVQREHPSVKFQHGEVKDFETAMTTYLAQYWEEIVQLVELRRQHPTEIPVREVEETKEDYADLKRQVQVAREIYQRVVTEAYTRAAEEMRVTGEPHLREIADAVQRQNYSILAL